MGFTPGWHYVTQSISGLLVDYFYFRIDYKIQETLRRFCRDEDLQKSSSRRNKVSDSQKKVSRRRFETSCFKISPERKSLG